MGNSHDNTATGPLRAMVGVRTSAWILVVGAAGCFPSSDAGPTTDASTSSSGDTTSGTSMGTDGTGSTGSGTSVTTGPAAAPSDCKALLAQEPETPDGIHALTIADGPDAGTTFSAYCDMTTDGGGWTLVGRSTAAGAPEAFGWSQSTGSVDDDAMPFSLDVVAAGLRFREVLIGEYSRGKLWGDNAFTKVVPPDFVVLYGAAPWLQETVTVAGDCMPPGGPTNLRYIGFANLDMIFAVSGADGDTSRGLTPAGWLTGASDCDAGGRLDTRQGMIFVR